MQSPAELTAEPVVASEPPAVEFEAAIAEAEAPATGNKVESDFPSEEESVPTDAVPAVSVTPSEVRHVPNSS